MHQLIIKQNVKLSGKFNKISIFIYICSAVFTAIFFSFSFGQYVIGSQSTIDSNLYRNVIGLNFITDYFDKSLISILYINCIYIPLLVISFIFIFLIQGFVKDRASIDKINEEDETNKDKTIKSSLKLRTFKLKLLAYPLLNLAYICPVLLYAWMEYYYLTHLDERQERINMLRVRYSFYNIYIFMNSIRGWLFFKVFILNEKIKKLLFDKYLNFEIFKTIDKINEYDELLNNRSSNVIESTNLTKFEKNISLNDDINSNKKLNKDEISNKKTDKDDTNKNKTKLINDDDEESDEDDDE
jgi:hypothetical protein